MPAIANSTQSPLRATFAKMLARLSVGLSLAGVLSSSLNALGQQCDRCASLQAGTLEPSCGCEPCILAGRSKNRCTVPCVPKPSFAEKFLKRLDELGDSIEARSMASCRLCNSINVKSNCDCTSAVAPSCGCESKSIPSASTSWQNYGSIPKATYPFPDNPNMHAIGSLGDQIVAPPTIEAPIAPSRTTPQVGLPMENVPADTFGGKSSPTPQRRLPADERAPFLQGPSNALPVPALDKPYLPDVLVDPFKDDVSASKSLRRRGVSLASDMQSTKSEPLMRGKKPLNPDSVALPDAPAKLTPAQLTVSSIQFDAVKPVAPISHEQPMVVSSSFWNLPTVTISPRRDVRSTDQENAPHVRRIQVPQKR